MSTHGPSSQLHQIMDVSNFSTSACNIFSSMVSSDSDDDFQKSKLDPQQSQCVYLLTYKIPIMSELLVSSNKSFC